MTDFNKTLIFSTDFLEIPNVIFITVRPVEAEFFHAGGRTDGKIWRN
jgi:hypothetical protein